MHCNRIVTALSRRRRFLPVMAVGFLSVTSCSIGTANEAGVRVKLSAPQNALLGEEVPFGLTLENTGTSAREYLVPENGDPFNPVVTTKDGRDVWMRYSVHSRSIRLVLPPGTTLHFQFYWDQRDASGNLVPPGEYRVRGLQASHPGLPTTRSAVFRIGTP